MDANVPAGLLKLWIRELPEPLIVEDTYELALEAGRKIRKGKQHTHTLRAGGRAEGQRRGAERACAYRQPLTALPQPIVVAQHCGRVKSLACD
jgi:hypothetical protein